MSKTNQLPSFTAMSDYLDSLIKYYSADTTIENTKIPEFQDSVDDTFLKQAESAVESKQRDVLMDTAKSAQDYGLQGIFTTMESSLRLNQAMHLFMSRSVCDYLRYTDRDGGKVDE